MMQTVVDFATSSGGIGLALLLLLAAFLGPAEVRRRRVALATYHAFHMVEDLVAECRASGREFPYLNKARAGLAFANEWMRANGWRPLKGGEEDRAQLGFKSLHGERKAGATRATAQGILLALLLLPLTMAVSGCVPGFHRHPAVQSPPACEAWKSAELAWGALDIYVKRALEQERAMSCTLPPALPQPAQ
jgi:hypothetical protein